MKPFLVILLCLLCSQVWGQRHLNTRLLPQGDSIIFRDCYYEWGVFVSNGSILVHDPSVQSLRVYDTTGQFQYAFKPQFAYKDRKYSVGTPPIVSAQNWQQQIHLASFFSVLVYHKADSQIKTIPISIDFKKDTMAYLNISKKDRVYLGTYDVWLTPQLLYTSFTYSQSTPGNLGFWLLMTKKMLRNKQPLKARKTFHPSLPLIGVYRITDTTSLNVGTAKASIRVTPKVQFSHYVGQLDSFYYHHSRSGYYPVPGGKDIFACMDMDIDTLNGRSM
jgi:hypothetical protein